MGKNDQPAVVIIGAGPAGLSAAYELCKVNLNSVTVLEQDEVVGGLSKTVAHKGFRFDIGGHRFYTKVKAVEDIWREVLSEKDFLRRQRLSRIYYNKTFFYYPLRASSLLFKMGLWNSCLIVFSYLHARIFPQKVEQTFEQWVTNRFGRRLYRTFFKSYTEKVWGIPCSQITAEWATQRIKGLSLGHVLKDLFFRYARKGKGASVKSLIGEFDYPRLGPGMMWESMAELIRIKGGKIRTDTQVEKIRWRDGAVQDLEITSAGQKEILKGDQFISSMPVRELINKLEPAPPGPVVAAANNLQYRDFITVVLIVNRAELFPDNWIYVHDPEVKMGRVQNFKNWSREMVPDQAKTCLGLEYFCFEGDGLWNMSNEELVALGTRELEKLGLAKADEVDEGTVLRVPKAYPVYDSTYKQSLALVRQFCDGLSNLQLVGRNGMHKYNNQDHSMITAMLAAKNILGASYDLWEVNAEQEYHEEVAGSEHDAAAPLFALSMSQPRVPERIMAAAANTSVVEFEA